VKPAKFLKTGFIYDTINFGFVSQSFRPSHSIMLGMVTKHDQKEKGKTTGFIRKSTNFIRFVAKLTEKPFQMCNWRRRFCALRK